MKTSEIRKIAAQYPKVVEWSDADGCFVGRCPLLFNGGVHGVDEAKVYKELCDTAEEWVKILRDDRVPFPKTKALSEFSGKFVVRIDPSLHQRLAMKALAKGESLNALVEKALVKA
jgi:predicted HicB family RNase H-like nuclease